MRFHFIINEIVKKIIFFSQIRWIIVNNEVDLIAENVNVKVGVGMDIKTQYDDWLNQAKSDQKLRASLERMCDEEKKDSFYRNLEFGTGGVRGIIGPGTNRLNIYTIRKINVGFAHYLLNNVPDVRTRGIVIAYDNRHYSPEFAMESAKVLATWMIKTYVFESLRPTPELSFAIRHLQAAGGIMITASHNPPTYNGYKVYDETGCQLLPSEESKVMSCIDAVEQIFSIVVKSEAKLKEAGLIEFIGNEIDAAYISRVKTIEINANCAKKELKIVFSPLHGTAYKPISFLLNSCGYTSLHFVKAQISPDPDFPTVESPNPEDAEAFTLAIEEGKKTNADILIITDPDADRMGVAVKDPTGKYKLLTGNEIGVILLYYILTQRKKQGTLPVKGYAFNTVVTSGLGEKIAQDYGFETISTLTGFKFIGEQARLIQDTEHEFLFGYEESCGYLIDDFVRDKDAIQAVLMCAEVAAFYKERGRTLYDLLMEIYKTYGFYDEALVSIILTGKEGNKKIQTILSSFRKMPPNKVAGLDVVIIEDYQSSTRRNIRSDTVKPIELPMGNVLKYILEDGSWFALRPSGTEPKAKIYMSVVKDNANQARELVAKIKDDVLAQIDSFLKGND